MSVFNELAKSNGEASFFAKMTSNVIENVKS